MYSVSYSVCKCVPATLLHTLTCDVFQTDDVLGKAKTKMSARNVSKRYLSGSIKIQFFKCQCFYDKNNHVLSVVIHIDTTHLFDQLCQKM